MKTMKLAVIFLSLAFGLSSQSHAMGALKNDLLFSREWLDLKSNEGWIDCGSNHIAAMFGKHAANSESPVGVREMYYYTHPQVNPENKPILVVLLHGTFASVKPEYFMPGTTTFEYAKAFAQHLGCKNQTAVCFISYQWSGLNKHDARIKSGKKLAKILDAHFSDFQIITLAHSHGGNVVNVASNALKKVGLDTLIHLATPVLENTNKVYKPKNFKTLLNFYTNGDIVQCIGALDTSNSFADIFSIKGSSRKIKKKKTGRVINIRTQLDGYDTNHAAIKSILKDMHLITNKMTIYRAHDDLDMNISSDTALYATDAHAKILLAIRNTPDEGIAPLEVHYSNYQKNQFLNIYNKDISYKGNALQSAYSKTSNTIAMIKPFAKFKALFVR